MQGDVNSSGIKYSLHGDVTVPRKQITIEMGGKRNDTGEEMVKQGSKSCFQTPQPKKMGCNLEVERGS